MARPRRLLNVKDVLERLVCLDQDLDREAIRGNLTIADFNDLIFKDELHSMANVAILILSSAKRKGRKDVRIEELGGGESVSDDPFDIDRKEDAGELAYEHKHGIKSKEALTNDEQGAGCIIECIWARKLRNERDDMMREKILKEQRNPFFLPGDKVRDTRDAYRKTWRIVKRIAYDDTEKMTLREVGNDSNERTVLANQLIPFLEMVAKARTEEPIEHPSFTRAKALPEPWRSHFPKDVDDARMWLPEYRRVALDRTVLLVAKTRVECAWACYVMGVPGKNHDEEQFDVSHYGSKLTEERARFFFPEFAEVPYAD